MALRDGYLIVNGVECETVSVREKMYVIVGIKLCKLYYGWVKNKRYIGGKARILKLKGICQVCGDEFYGRLYSLRKFCGLSCKNKINGGLAHLKHVSFSEDIELKKKAMHFISNAIAGGKIIRPEVCSNCKLHGSIIGHHPDHNKFNEVIWLCTYCHSKLHYGHDIKGELVIYNL